MRNSNLIVTGVVAAVGVMGTTNCMTMPTESPEVDMTSVEKVTPTNGAAVSKLDFAPLITRHWEIAAGATDIYKCTRIQVDHDMTITGFRSLSPFGTHHSAITISSPDAPLGDYDCTGGLFDPQLLFATGLNTNDMIFPTDTGIFIPAGTKLNLNLHLFNATDTPISGESGVLFRESASVSQQADMFFGGTLNVSIPNNDETTTLSGTCTLARDFTMFSVWPHMHQIGTHQKVEWIHDGVSDTLLDTDYQFTSQKSWPLAQQRQFHAGDQIKVTCSWLNNEDHVVTFGERSEDEMCFAGIYRYPAGGALYECLENAN